MFWLSCELPIPPAEGISNLCFSASLYNQGNLERNEAFDFNVTLSDHKKYVRREHEKESGESSENDTHIDIHPAVNHRLKVYSFEFAKIVYHLGILCSSYFV